MQSSGEQKSVGSTTKATTVQQPEDAFGEFGRSLTAWHVGDLTGVVGLLLTVASTIAAFSARRAAKEAATAAIARRDTLEIASKLSELAQRLRIIGQIYNTADWTALSVNKDSAVSLVTELTATLRGEGRAVELMVSIRNALREEHQTPDQVKDEARRARLQSKWHSRISSLADSVDEMKHERVKNGT